MDVARRLPCSKNSTARSVHNLDALWTNANLPWENQAPFFCRHLLYVLDDEIWREICGGDHFLKCMFSAWKTKNKSISPLYPWYFSKMHSNCDFWYMVCDTSYMKIRWKPRHFDTSCCTEDHYSSLENYTSYWNTGSVAGKIMSTWLFGKLNAL